jgi:hypothetical protein
MANLREDGMAIRLKSNFSSAFFLIFISTFASAQNTKQPVAIVIRAPQSAKSGSVIKVDITMTNVSNRAVKGRFESAIHGELNFDIEVLDSERKPAPQTCYMRAIGGLDRGNCPDFMMRTHRGAGQDSIAPGETIKGSSNLNELFELRPGTYTVQVSWFELRPTYNNAQAPRSPNAAPVVKSNLISVTVTP